MLLKAFHLPTFAREYANVAMQAAKEGVTHEAYLHVLARQEASERAERRVERLLTESRLPCEKTIGCYDLSRLPAKVRISDQGEHVFRSNVNTHFGRR